MNRKIVQIDITRALEMAKNNEEVFVIANPEKPAVKIFKNMSVGEAINQAGEFIFFVIEEA